MLYYSIKIQCSAAANTNDTDLYNNCSNFNKYIKQLFN